MRFSGVRWALATVAPWALAAGVLVSFSADAGIDATAGYEVVHRNASSLSREPDRLIAGLDAATLGVAPRFGDMARSGLIHSVRLPEPDAESEPFAPVAVPRDDMKHSVQGFPSVDRSHKGDALVTLRPTLNRQPTTSPGSGILTRDLAHLPPTILLPMTGDVPGPDSVASFEPETDLRATTPGAAFGANSPGAGPSELTAAARASGSTTTGIGSTPSVPRAAALSSTTPAPADAIPVEIAAAPVSPEGLSALKSHGSGMSVVPRDDARPSYASLINPENMSKEERCLAEAIYFEARSESEEGQAAVAQVVLNRVRSGLYPTTVCGVVYQNRNRRNACQFSFACEGRALRVTEPDSWQTAVRIAREVTFGDTYNAEVGGATHYHADYVRPFWAKRLKKMDVIGRHIFYKLRRGQT